MLYQIFEVISIYLDFEIVTRFEVQQMKILPKIHIEKLPMISNFDKHMKIYPEMKHKTVNSYKHTKKKIFESFFRLLLVDNRLNDFHRIAETEKTFKRCHFVTNNKLINCSKVDIGVTQNDDFLSIIYDLTYSRIVDKSKIEKITLSLNPFQLLYVYIFLYHNRHS
jgi:hypothetical protein